MNVRIPTPEKMQKYPWGATVGVLFSLCLVLVGIIVRRPACDAEDWKKAYQEEREKNDKLTTALIVQKYAIEELRSNKDTLNTPKNENVN